MKKQPIEYVVFLWDEEIGRAMAVSEAQAINNLRFTNKGPLGMWEEGSDEGYSATPAVVLNFWENNAKAPTKRARK